MVSNVLLSNGHKGNWDFWQVLRIVFPLTSCDQSTNFLDDWDFSVCCSAYHALPPTYGYSSAFFSSLSVIATMRDLRKKDKLEVAAGDALNKTLTIQRLDVCSDESVFECVNSLPEKRLDVLGKSSALQPEKQLLTAGKSLLQEMLGKRRVVNSCHLLKPATEDCGGELQLLEPYIKERKTLGSLCFWN